MWISVVTYSLKDIHNDQDYLHSLGNGQIAQMQKSAQTGQVDAKRRAGIQDANAKQ